MQVMEQESFFSEKSSFANKNYKKYGTTTNNNLKRNQPNEILIRHEVSKSDTLEGIALKFGCSMEQIRRANRLFTNDSLFLREYLMIPVNNDSPYYSADNSEIKPTHHHMLSKRANTIAAPSTSKEPFSPNDSIDSISSSTTADDDDQRKFMEDFLEKIDSSIASSKKIVRDHQQNSDYVSSSQSDDSLFSSSATGNSFVNHNYDPSGSGTSYQQMYQSLSHQSARYSLGGVSDTSQLVVRSNGRHVKNSLQKLQKQQDEIFEL